MSFQEPVNATDICALRRDVHRWPEPGWAEFVSSARVIEHLEKAGLKVLCGREVINDAFIRGANRKQIEAGLAAAREKGQGRNTHPGLATLAYVQLNSMGASIEQVGVEYVTLWVQSVVYFLLACWVYRRNILKASRALSSL